MFSSAEATLARIEKLSRRPASSAPANSIRRSVSVTEREVDGGLVYELSPSGGPSGKRAVFLHGGCYVFEIDPLHWKFVANLVREANVTVTVPIMPLAPSGVASVVVDRVANIVQSLIAEAGAGNVSIVGDSSGGGMALAVAMELRDRNHQPLRAIVLSAPWLDISGTDPQLEVIAPSDPWLAVPGTRAAGELYRAELPENDWRVSPIHGDFDNLGPLTVFTGTRDIVHADAMRLQQRAAAENIPIDYHVGEGMIHNYPILPIPEGAAARAVIVSAIA